MPAMVKIDGTFYTADSIQRIVPGTNGAVMVSMERRRWKFEVTEGTEEQWAANFAAQLGTVVDTSDTPVTSG